jgi:hypothetical protein
MFEPSQDVTTRTAIDSLAKAFAIDPHKAELAAASIGDALTGSMIRSAASRGGLADLVEILGARGRDAYFKPDAPLNAPVVEADGIGILSQLLGSRDKSRAVAARAAKQSGLSQDVVKAILPSVAAILTGSLAGKTQQAFGDILKIPGLDEIAREARDDMGGGGQLAPPQYGSPLPLPGEPPRRYSPTPNDDWSASTGRTNVPPSAKPAPSPAPSSGGPTTPDSGGLREQRPLPIPGDDTPGMGPHEDNPYGDLSDILRRGGFRLPEGFPFPMPGGRPGGGAPRRQSDPTRVPDTGSADAGGGLLANIIRNILGSVLGGGRSGSGGSVSWIIRLIVLRYGAKILQWIVRRVLGR